MNFGLLVDVSHKHRVLHTILAELGANRLRFKQLGYFRIKWAAYLPRDGNRVVASLKFECDYHPVVKGVAILSPVRYHTLICFKQLVYVCRDRICAVNSAKIKALISVFRCLDE